MKKIVLLCCAVAMTVSISAQFSVTGVSPAIIAGQYDHGVQAGCGAYPGVTDDGTWNTLSAIDFNIPGTFIQDTLMLVDDASVGINPQGNPIAQEGCNALVNDLTGKIAVAYRNTCFFSSKVFYAQEAGAVAIIVINREAGVIDMAANTDPVNGPLGTDCTIPAIFLDQTDGEALVQAMANGPVVMFMGNKLGANANDAGAFAEQMLIPDYGTSHSALFNGFTPGIQAYNYGANTNDISIQCTIDGPSGNVYDETVTRTGMVTGDTMAAFSGNPEQFTPWDLGIGNYENGDYTLTYTISCVGFTDDDDSDNVLTSVFNIQDNVVSLARLDVNGNPIANSFPSNTTNSYTSCMMFRDANASQLALKEITFVPTIDTSVVGVTWDLMVAGIDVYEYIGLDFNDPGYTGLLGPGQDLVSVSFTEWYPSSESDLGAPQTVDITPIVLSDNQAYFVCLNNQNTPEVAYGYDGDLNYDGNQGIYGYPPSPVEVEGTWYGGGWNGVSAASISLGMMDAASVGVDNIAGLTGKIYPNPGVDQVTILLNNSGNANLQVADVSGKILISKSLTFVNGRAEMNIEKMVQGLYICTVTLEDGTSTQFNFVKN